MTQPIIERAALADAQSILALQKLAYESEAQLYGDWTIPPLTQSLESLCAEFASSIVLKASDHGRIVGSVRARQSEATCEIGRLIVHPHYQRRGIGSMLLRAAEVHHPAALRFELFTGSRSEGNIRLYERHGYSIVRTQLLSSQVTLVFMEKKSGE